MRRDGARLKERGTSSLPLLSALLKAWKTLRVYALVQQRCEHPLAPPPLSTHTKKIIIFFEVGRVISPLGAVCSVWSLSYYPLRARNRAARSVLNY